MVVFLLGWSTGGAVDSASVQSHLHTYVTKTPFFAGANRATWTSKSGRFSAAWVAHDSDQLGGVRYVATDPLRLALFAGRPIRWVGDREADGRTPLDPSYYLGDPDRWADTLDGRFFAAYYDDSCRSLTVCTDQMGAYPVFRLRQSSDVWISNAPSLLQAVLGSTELDLEVVAEHVACGWSLEGKPWWRGVERVERGVVITYAESKSTRVRELLPVEAIAPLYGQRRPIADAARMLVVSLRALSDWPGRPNWVPVTGGKDSRLLLPAAIAARLDCEFVTGGTIEQPDVVVAKELCARAGVPHRLLPLYPYWSVEKDHLRMAQLLADVMGGMVTTGDAKGYPIEPVPGPFVLWHSGQGGEIARGFYGLGGQSVGAVASALFEKVSGVDYGQSELLSRDAGMALRSKIRYWVDAAVQSGTKLADVPDLFYALNRMPNWSAPGHGCVEFVRDTTSPLWSHRMLPYLVAASAVQRRRAYFHYNVLRELDAALLRVPFAADAWPTWHSELGKRARKAASLARKAMIKAIRESRATATRNVGTNMADAGASPFARVMETTRKLMYSQDGHPAWQVLDRAQMDSLFSTPAASLTGTKQQRVWCLLDVFSTPLSNS